MAKNQKRSWRDAVQAFFFYLFRKIVLTSIYVGVAAALWFGGKYFLTYAFGGKPDSVDYREAKVSESEKLYIGAIWPQELNDHFFDGVTLAVEEINEHGGLLGRKIELIYMDESTNYDTALKRASQLAATPNLYAVIGHTDSSNSSVAASVIYESHGIIMITPGSSNRRLVTRDFQSIFQTISDDHEIGTALVEVCAALEYRNIAIVYEMPPGGRGMSYGESLSNAFVDRAPYHDVKVTLRRSFFTGETNFIDILNSIKDHEVDAVVLATLPQGAVDFLHQAKQVGLKLPFLGGDRLESANLPIDAAGGAEGLLIVSPGDPTKDSPMGLEFRDIFFKRWGVYPPVWAAKGYDAIQLLAYSITRSQTLEHEVVTSFLRSIKDWNGVSGIYSFHEQGDVYGLNLYLREVHHGGIRPYRVDSELAERIRKEDSIEEGRVSSNIVLNEEDDELRKPEPKE